MSANSSTSSSQQSDFANLGAGQSPPTFRRTFRGYDPDEVHMALGILKADIARLEFDLAQLKGDLPPASPQAATGQIMDSEPDGAHASWFENRWAEGDDPQLDEAFQRFFAEPDQAE